MGKVKMKKFWNVLIGIVTTGILVAVLIIILDKYGSENQYEVTCSACNGAKKLPCYMCGGKGHQETYYGTRTDCTKCEGGTIQCSNCWGTGKKTMQHLNSNKQQPH
jgi:hypothetical protein